MFILEENNRVVEDKFKDLIRATVNLLKNQISPIHDCYYIAFEPYSYNLEIDGNIVDDGLLIGTACWGSITFYYKIFQKDEFYNIYEHLKITDKDEMNNLMCSFIVWCVVHELSHLNQNLCLYFNHETQKININCFEIANERHTKHIINDHKYEIQKKLGFKFSKYLSKMKKITDISIKPECKDCDYYSIENEYDIINTISLQLLGMPIDFLIDYLHAKDYKKLEIIYKGNTYDLFDVKSMANLGAYICNKYKRIQCSVKKKDDTLKIYLRELKGTSKKRLINVYFTKSWSEIFDYVCSNNNCEIKNKE